MGIVQKQAFNTMLLSYVGMAIGYLNKGLIFVAILNTTQIGLINLLVSVGVLFALLAGFGSNNMFNKFFPYLKTDNKKHHGILALNFYLSVFGIIAFSIIAIIFKNQICSLYLEKSPIFVEYYYWFILIGAGSVFYNLVDSYLKSNFQNVLSVFVYEVLLRLLTLTLLLTFYFQIIDFHKFVVLHSFIYFIPGIILFYYIYKSGALFLRPKFIQISKRWKRIMLNFSLFSYSNSLGSQMVLTMDALMIASLSGMSETGVYTTVVFLTSALQVPYKAMARGAQALVPIHWRNRDMNAMNILYEKFSTMGLFIGLSATLALFLISDTLFSFFPKEFSEGTTLLFFLMTGKIIDMYFGLNGFLLVTSKKYRWDLVFTTSLLLITFFLNLYFIPKYGLNGAAIATSIALILYNFGRVVVVYLFFKLLPFHKRQLGIFIILSVSFLIAYFLPLDILNTILASIIRLIVFGFGVLLLIFKTSFIDEVKQSILVKFGKYFKY